MRINKLFGTALAVALASTLALSGCGEQEKQLIRMSHSQIETHPDHLGLFAFYIIFKSN